MPSVTLKTLTGETIEYDYYDYKTFPYKKLSASTHGKLRTKDPARYLNTFGTFDIETTTIPTDEERFKFAFMYHWQMCVGGYVCTGRYWNEFISFLRQLINHLNIHSNRKFIIYVHNLGYEYQFMHDFLERAFGEMEVFAPQPRKPLSLRLENGIEFRCSWKLSNMTLEKACTSERGVEIGKQNGDLDYKIIRAPVTLLTPIEIGYCVGDVVSLYQYIENRLKNEHDTLASIPMTSTGYVRRDCRRAASADKRYRAMFLSQRMTPEVYTLLKSAGRGGDTHANRYLSGKIIGGVDSYDVQSSYPYVLCTKKFPMTKFTPYGDIESEDELQSLLDDKACLFRVIITNVRVKEEYAMPYISESKCENVVTPLLDNGRILSASALCMVVTDIDYKLIAKQYTFDEIYVSDMHIAEYGYLPQCLVDVILEYYREKTRLKGEIAKAKKAGDKEKAADLQYLYDRQKNRLNGIFGMMYTDPVRDRIYIAENGEWKSETPDIEESLEGFYKSRNSFLNYAWGVWTTAHARAHLARLVDLTGQANTAYCDTDSSKAFDVDEALIEAANAEIIVESESRGAYADYDGIRYYMGIYEHENKNKMEFKTLGAKKYVYVDEEGLHVTISGVNKKAAPKELMHISNFVPGFTFYKAGGQELTYINHEIRKITVNGSTFESASCVTMEDSTYEIGVTGDYAGLIGYNILTDIDHKSILNII